MERHRCTKCRNPIRSGAVARPGAGVDAWYHPACWAEVGSFEQENYEQQVRSSGLSALLAPYLSVKAAAEVAVASGTFSEQPQA